MINWGQVSAVVAMGTIPIFASSLLVQPFFQKMRETAVRAYYRNNRCEAIEWSDMSHNPIRTRLQQQAPSPTTTSGRVLEAGDVNDGEITKNMVLAQFLHDVWRVVPQPVPLPSYLNVAKEYLRLDADVLLAVLLLGGGSGSLKRQPDPGTRCILEFGWTTAQFRVFETEDNFYVVGKLGSIPHFKPTSQGYEGITKQDLRAIADGYPPFYRQLIRMNSGVEIAHPIQSMRDIHRAGWLVAVGLSCATFTPLRMYDARKLPAYSEACDRVRETAERLQREFSPGADATRKALLNTSVRVITRMNKYRTGSGADSANGGRDDWTIGCNLSAPEILFALKFFNRYQDGELSSYDREELDPILEEVLVAAMYGVFTWWQYVNNDGHEIPGWLLDDRVRLNPIWLEDDLASRL